ncbi:MAG: hypothetical protein DSZ05_05185 [Sulfurospirillum sp.]|nr:MAG: hypothetical protein DSZ05_05185 [Sulfurospirillum sp.]
MPPCQCAQKNIYGKKIYIKKQEVDNSGYDSCLSNDKKFENSKDAKEVLEGEIFYTIPDRIEWFSELGVWIVVHDSVSLYKFRGEV